MAGTLAAAMVITSAAVTSPSAVYAAKSTVTVSTQSQLDRALKTVKKSNKINAAKAKIDNSAKFASIAVSDA